MERPRKHFYEFSGFRIDPQERVLFREGKIVPLTPKVFDTLLALVEHRRNTVSREELLKFVWPDSFVEEGNLTQNISMLRKLLGENAEEPHFIETVPRRGYRFVASVNEVDEEEPAAPAPIIPIERRLPVEYMAGGILILLVAGGLGIYRIFRPRVLSAPRALAVTRLTYAGKSTRIAISPDGRYAVEAVAEGSKQSLWLRQVAAPSEIQIVPPAEVSYLSITFSSDGNYLYFVKGLPGGPGEGSFSDRGTLYKMPVLGKDEKKLIENVDGHIALSPNGDRLAFVRQYPKQGRSVLHLAGADGTGERELAVRSFPDNYLPGGPAWSPDGKTIACATNNFSADIPYRGIVGIDVATGKERPIGTKHWYGATKRLAWLADGSGLLVLGAEYSRGLNQIWLLSAAGNESRRLVNDLNDYADMSLTADAKIMATVRSDRMVNLWVAPAEDASRAQKITAGTGREDGVRGLTWTPDGRIIFRSMVGDAPHLWIVNRDGTGARQLTADGGEHFDPAVSPDGKSIVWSSSAAGRRNLWRMGLDGTNPEGLSNGSNEWHPDFSPDGKWLVIVTTVHSLAKLPATGGPLARLTNGLSWRPAISPDGKWIAYNRLDEPSGQWQIGVIPFEGEAPPRIFNAPSPSIFRALRWTPDGRGIAYPVTTGNVSNLWMQPLDGGPPRRWTAFNDQTIFDFAWSRDGKQLVFSRGVINSDIVLLSNFK